MSADSSTYRIVNIHNGRQVRVFNRRSLAGWFAQWYPFDRSRLPLHYRIERAVHIEWQDVTGEFLEQPSY